MTLILARMREAVLLDFILGFFLPCNLNVCTVSVCFDEEMYFNIPKYILIYMYML